MPKQKAKLKDIPLEQVDAPKVGRPSDYDESCCQKLIDHMRKGNSFDSFGAEIMRGKTTLYEWLKKYEEFRNAKEIGTILSLKFYEDLGKLIVTGQLKRVSKETVVMIDDPKNPGSKIPYIGTDGKPVYNREYTQATAGQAVYIFMMKNMHKWRDNVDVNLGEGQHITLSYKLDKPTEEDTKKYELKK